MQQEENAIIAYALVILAERYEFEPLTEEGQARREERFAKIRDFDGAFFESEFVDELWDYPWKDD